MKQRVVEFAPEALQDLRDLYDWIAQIAGPGVAFGYIERLESYCREMETAAERGTLRSDIRPGVRFVGFERRVTIAFRVTETNVVILRLFYAGRNWTTSFS